MAPEFSLLIQFTIKLRACDRPNPIVVIRRKQEDCSTTTTMLKYSQIKRDAHIGKVKHFWWRFYVQEFILPTKAEPISRFNRRLKYAALMGNICWLARVPLTKTRMEHFPMCAVQSGSWMTHFSNIDCHPIYWLYVTSRNHYQISQHQAPIRARDSS